VHTQATSELGPFNKAKLKFSPSLPRAGPLSATGIIMVITGKFTAKRGKFKGLNDDPDTWRMLYKKGGEELLREYAEHMLTEHDFFAHRADSGLMDRLCLVLASIWMSPDQFWYFAFKKLSEPDRYFLCINKHCPEELIEALWIGDYYCTYDGTPNPDAVASGAYFSNYRKALSIYARRPDLRAVVGKAMRSLYEYSLKREGIIAVADDFVDLSTNIRMSS